MNMDQPNEYIRSGTSRSTVPMDPDAIPRLAAVLARAFEQDSLFGYVFPHAPTRTRLLRRFFAPGLRYAHQYGIVHTTSDLAGCAMWLTPEHPQMTLRGMARTGMLLYPLTVGVSAFRRFLNFVNYADRCHAQAIQEPHWYLFILGIDPTRQHQGIGSALLRPMLDRADEHQQACYLETDETHYQFYEQHGFHVVTPGRIPHGGPELWTMLRPPRKV